MLTHPSGFSGDRIRPPGVLAPQIFTR